MTDLPGVIDKFNLLLAALAPLSLMTIGGGLEAETAGGTDPDKLRLAFPKLTKTTSYLVVAADRAKLIEFALTADNAEMTIEAAATLGEGWSCMIAPTGTKFLIINPNSTELIDGVAQIRCVPGEPPFMLVCGGSAFYTIGRGARALWAVLDKTGAYTIALTDYLTVIHATSGTWTLTLPALSAVPDGFAFMLRNSGAGTVTADGNASETIDGATTLAFAQNASAIIVKYASGWLTLGRSAASPIFSKSFESTQQVITSAGALTLAHGMGEVPKQIAAKLVCIDAGGEQGYVQNEEIYIGTLGVQTNGEGHRIKADATNVLVRFGSRGQPYPIVNDDTGGTAYLTNSKWRLVVMAWA